jgi:DNA-binding transcriptional ArsR family regulator
MIAMLRNNEMLPIDDLARMLRAVSDPARLRLLRLCFDQPTSVSELAAAVADSEPNVSRQLKQLATAGLLRRARRGQSVEYLPMIGGGFAAELALQLLARIDPVDPELCEARARLRALETGGATAAELLASSRLGRALAAALDVALARDDATGARVLAHVGHRELLELLARRPSRVTLRIDTAVERTVVQRWAESEGLVFDYRNAKQTRESPPYDVCVEVPRPNELRELAQVSPWLGRLRDVLGDDGVLWLALPYDLLDHDGIAPPLRLRALLDEQGFDCLTLAPVEAEGRHLLITRSRARARRSERADLTVPDARRGALGV